MAGYFVRKRDIPFSQVSNEALRDPKLSLRAKGLYCVIQSYISIPGFTLYKPHLRQIAQLGPKAFDGDWDELKKNGYLKQARVRTESGFVYEYELLDQPDLDSPATVNIGLDGTVVSVGNGKNEPSSTEVGSNLDAENEPTPVGVGSNLDVKNEPTPFCTGLNSNPVQERGCINNTYINNTYSDKSEGGSKAINSKSKAVEKAVDDLAFIRAKIVYDLRQYLAENQSLPADIITDNIRCTEAIRLLTHWYDYVEGDTKERYSNNPAEQDAYDLLVETLIRMCSSTTALAICGQKVQAEEIVLKLNQNIETDSCHKFSLSTLIGDVIDNYRQAEMQRTIKNRSAYMRACIWSRLCDGPKAQYDDHDEIPHSKPGETIDFPAQPEELATVSKRKKELRTYIMEHRELPFNILDSEELCTIAIHLLTHFNVRYSDNKLEQSAFELFNYSLIQMCLAKEPLKPRGAYVTSAKVLEQLNKCIDFSDDPFCPFGLDVMVDIINDYRQAEMKQAERHRTIKNKLSYMQSCIWTRLITHQIDDGIIQEQIGMYAIE